MLTIDADAHVVEGATFATEALTRWPDHVKLDRTPEGTPLFTIEGRRYPEASGPGAGCPPQHGLSTAVGDPFSPAGVLADADREGIDRMVLFPSLALGVGGFEDLRFAAEFARAYNRFIVEYCRESRGRLLGVAVVPLEDVDAAVAVLREARNAGCVGAVVPPALRTRNLDHPDLEPFYAAAVELDMPLGVHGAPGVHLPKIGVDRFTNYIQVHCVSFPFDQMTAMTALLSGGVFDRHPRLRVAFLESGVTWVPYFLDRMHEHFEKRGDWIPGGWRARPARVRRVGADLRLVRVRRDTPPRGRRCPRRRLRALCQRLSALGQRVPRERARAARAHRPHRRGACQDHGRERAAILPVVASRRAP